jgi:hypothetical protein
MSTSSGMRAFTRRRYRDALEKGTQGVKSAGPLKSTGGLFQRARVAQLAEQGTLNPKVQGSTPCASTKKRLSFPLSSRIEPIRPPDRER